MAEDRTRSGRNVLTAGTLDSVVATWPETPEEAGVVALGATNQRWAFWPGTFLACPGNVARRPVTPTLVPHPPHLPDEVVALALSGDYARRILSVCIRKPRSAREIERDTGLAPATVYRYLHQLQESHLMIVERSALTGDGKRYDLYRSRLRAARVELDASGVRVAWEPMDGMEERLTRVWATLRGT